MNADRLDSSLLLRARSVVMLAEQCPSRLSAILAIGCDVVDAVQLLGRGDAKRI